ncbi:type 2 lanthipeptide synthetase LanM [Kibdelosporangium phytohabitans]|uniref:type 2 lanthipeptide synthetase LanM n=1 Tax=Kibdelosporangium phytohabitans TaxID=860235 RepID=UPI001470526C
MARRVRRWPGWPGRDRRRQRRPRRPAEIAADLNFEIDDLLPLVDAATMLDFVRVAGGDLTMTELGRLFTTAGIQDSRKIFAEQVPHRAPLVRTICTALASCWGRYAELFDYDTGTDRITAEPVYARFPSSRTVWAIWAADRRTGCGCERGWNPRMTGGATGGMLSGVPPNPTATGRLAETWWARGVALHERAMGEPLSATTAQQMDSGAPLGWFGVRLAEAGLDGTTAPSVFAETPASIAARIARPDWADAVERAVRVAEPLPAGTAVHGDWKDAFALVFRPFVAEATERVTAAVDGAVADVRVLADQFATGLGRRLAELAARTLVREMRESRTQLLGGDGAGRFADFVRRTATPAGLAALAGTYPVLARLLGQTSRFAADATIELLDRFAADRCEIVELLLHGNDPGLLTTIRGGQGDIHQRGRSVAFLMFANGDRVVYKPRDLRAHVWFNAAVSSLNRMVAQLDLRTAAVVAKPGYGWVEYVTARPLARLADADVFYRRQGALLALLHATSTSDVHYQNLIACGDQPVLVDAETLLQPILPGPHGYASDPAAQALATSVFRTALLPMMVVGEHGAVDMSGLGGDRGTVSPGSSAVWEFPATDRMRLVRARTQFAGAANRPRFDDRDLDPCDYETALLQGFRHGYDAVMLHRTELTRLVVDSAGMDVRVLVRPTRGYLTLLEGAGEPELLRDALDRDRLFDLLWTESAGYPLRRTLSRHEAADLWAGDVPLFTARPDQRDLWTSDGQREPDVLGETVLDQVRARIDGHSEADRRDQEWIISATLATRRPCAGHVSTAPLPGPVEVTAAQPERLLAVACGIADQIVARSAAVGDRVNWLGLELVDERQWLLMPMGAGLANGYTGVALFLAQLADLTGVAHYGDVARRAITPVAQLLDVLAAQPELAATVGPGGYHGFGGIAYALARMTTLLPRGETGRMAESAVDCAAAATGSVAGWAHGIAGCLAAMVAVHAELGTPSAARLAESCADHLRQALPRDASGFADGSAGIGLALARFGGAGSSVAHLGQEVLAASAHRGDDGWCCGRAGLVAARSAFLDDADLERATRNLAERPMLRDLSLCHGELGITEALTVIAERHPAAVPVLRARAGLVLDSVNRYGVSCGTPGGVVTPGLLSGLAGIGYGLLRLGFPDRVPSVLLLEPSRR